MDGARTRGRAVAAAVLAVVLAALLVSACSTSDGRAGSESRVTRVSDGDTLVLADGRRVRLVQIDAPELAGDECHARAAARELERLAPPGSVVTLERDPELDAVDRYGRLLRYVWRGGTNVNLALVRLGAATVYLYRGERGRYAAELLQQAENARRARRGLWGLCPAARWDPSAAASTGTARR